LFFQREIRNKRIIAIVLAVMILIAPVSGCLGGGKNDAYGGNNSTAQYREGNNGHFWRNLWLYHVFFGNGGNSGTSGSSHVLGKKTFANDKAAKSIDVKASAKKSSLGKKKVTVNWRSGRRR